MKKTIVMLSGLAAVFAVSVACSKLFSSSSPPESSSVAACAGLSGQALKDCEPRHGQP
jgi:hypothetical protein